MIELTVFFYSVQKKKNQNRSEIISPEMELYRKVFENTDIGNYLLRRNTKVRETV